MLLSHLSSLPVSQSPNTPLPPVNAGLGVLSARVKGGWNNNYSLSYSELAEDLTAFTKVIEIIPQNSGFSYITGWIPMNNKIFVMMDSGPDYILDIESEVITPFNAPIQLGGRNILRGYWSSGYYFNNEYYFSSMSINPAEGLGYQTTIFKMTEEGVFSIDSVLYPYAAFIPRNFFVKDNKLHLVCAQGAIAILEEGVWTVYTNYASLPSGFMGGDCTNGKIIISGGNTKCLVGDNFNDLEIVDFSPYLHNQNGNFLNAVYFNGHYYLAGNYGRLIKTANFTEFENIGQTKLYSGGLQDSRVLVHKNKLYVISTNILFYSDNGDTFISNSIPYINGMTPNAFGDVNSL